MKFSAMRTNREKEDNGVWAPVAEGLEVKVARVNNHAYQDYLRKLTREKLGTVRAGELGSKVAEDITALAVSKYILLDWKNLQDDAGADIPYSQAKAFELLKESRDFLRIIINISSDAEIFRDQELKDAAKNS